MTASLLDLGLLVVVALFALSGYRQGLVVGATSFLGLLGGGLVGAQIAPWVARLGALDGVQDALAGLLVVLLLAVTGQLLGTVAGGLLRRRVISRPAHLVDAGAGAVVSALGALLVAWLLGNALASGPSPAVAAQVRRSLVLGAVDAAVPDPARRAAADLRRVVADRGPDVFGTLDPTRAAEVPPPDPALARSAVVREVRPRVLKVTGLARSCSRRVEGSGFVYAPERVMTNAHVVAGVPEPRVQNPDGGSLPGRVVVFDAARDVAVVHVPGLRAAPLAFAGPADAGDSAVVVGYPEDGPFRADAARVRSVQRARGTDIYGERRVSREVYAVRARLRPGNSGGPLVDARGRVLGVVFAAAADDPDTGYAVTAREVSGDADRGATATTPVSTGRCA